MIERDFKKCFKQKKLSTLRESVSLSIIVCATSLQLIHFRIQPSTECTHRFCWRKCNSAGDPLQNQKKSVTEVINTSAHFVSLHFFFLSKKGKLSKQHRTAGGIGNRKPASALSCLFLLAGKAAAVTRWGQQSWLFAPTPQVVPGRVSQNAEVCEGDHGQSSFCYLSLSTLRDLQTSFDSYLLLLWICWWTSGFALWIWMSICHCHLLERNQLNYRPLYCETLCILCHFKKTEMFPRGILLSHALS